MAQMTFSDVEYSHRKKTTKKEKFLQEMDAIIPWKRWTAMIVPIYPTGKRGRPPRGIELMLRIIPTGAASVTEQIAKLLQKITGIIGVVLGVYLAFV